jgi:hypothetical protein
MQYWSSANASESQWSTAGTIEVLVVVGLERSTLWLPANFAIG